MGEIISAITIKGSDNILKETDKTVLKFLKEEGKPADFVDGDFEFYGEEIQDSMEDAEEFLTWTVEEYPPFDGPFPCYNAHLL